MMTPNVNFSGWQIASADGVRVGINTALPNAFVAHAIEHGVLPTLRGYREHNRGRYGQERSRIDVHLITRTTSVPAL